MYDSDNVYGRQNPGWTNRRQILDVFRGGILANWFVLCLFSFVSFSSWFDIPLALLRRLSLQGKLWFRSHRLLGDWRLATPGWPTDTGRPRISARDNPSTEQHSLWPWGREFIPVVWFAPSPISSSSSRETSISLWAKASPPSLSQSLRLCLRLTDIPSV